jgi:hypothetical protein
MSKIKKIQELRVLSAPWENNKILLDKLNEVIDALNSISEPEVKKAPVATKPKKPKKEKPVVSKEE